MSRMIRIFVIFCLLRARQSVPIILEEDCLNILRIMDLNYTECEEVYRDAKDKKPESAARLERIIVEMETYRNFSLELIKWPDDKKLVLGDMVKPFIKYTFGKIYPRTNGTEKAVFDAYMELIYNREVVFREALFELCSKTRYPDITTSGCVYLISNLKQRGDRLLQFERNQCFCVDNKYVGLCQMVYQNVKTVDDSLLHTNEMDDLKELRRRVYDAAEIAEERGLLKWDEYHKKSREVIDMRVNSSCATYKALTCDVLDEHILTDRLSHLLIKEFCVVEMGPVCSRLFEKTAVCKYQWCWHHAHVRSGIAYLLMMHSRDFTNYTEIYSHFVWDKKKLVDWEFRRYDNLLDAIKVQSTSAMKKELVKDLGLECTNIESEDCFVRAVKGLLQNFPTAEVNEMLKETCRSNQTIVGDVEICDLDIEHIHDDMRFKYDEYIGRLDFYVGRDYLFQFTYSTLFPERTSRGSWFHRFHEIVELSEKAINKSMNYSCFLLNELVGSEKNACEFLIQRRLQKGRLSLLEDECMSGLEIDRDTREKCDVIFAKIHIIPQEQKEIFWIIRSLMSPYELMSNRTNLTSEDIKNIARARGSVANCLGVSREICEKFDDMVFTTVVDKITLEICWYSGPICEHYLNRFESRSDFDRFAQSNCENSSAVLQDLKALQLCSQIFEFCSSSVSSRRHQFCPRLEYLNSLGEKDLLKYVTDRDYNRASKALLNQYSLKRDDYQETFGAFIKQNETHKFLIYHSCNQEMVSETCTQLLDKLHEKPKNDVKTVIKPFCLGIENLPDRSVNGIMCENVRRSLCKAPRQHGICQLLQRMVGEENHSRHIIEGTTIDIAKNEARTSDEQFKSFKRAYLLLNFAFLMWRFSE